MASSVLFELLAWIVEFLAQVGLDWLLDDEDRRPWLAIFLAFSVTVGLAMLIFSDDLMGVWKWGIAVTIVLLAVFGLLDYLWWRERRLRKQRADQRLI